MDSRDPLRPLPETQAALDELNDLSDPDVAHLLEDLGRRVSDIAPDVVGLSVGLVKDGPTFTLVSTDSRLAALDATQSLDGGPCVEVADAGIPMKATMSDPLDEDRWSLFSRAGGLVGVASTLSLPIYRGGGVVGGLNLYASTETAFEGRHEQLAALLVLQPHLWRCAPGRVVTSSGTGLVATPPARPVQDRGCLGRLVPDEGGEQPSNLGHGERDQLLDRAGSPLSVAEPPVKTFGWGVSSTGHHGV
jgi:hypothetical protein